jgi:hypothetical protein
MRVNLNKIALSHCFALLLGMLSACSLEQRSSSDTVHLTLQKRSGSASSAMISQMAGLPAQNSRTYYMITVSGEGMLLAPIEGAGCLGITMPSTVFVPTSATGSQSVDLEVLVGRNRLVRLYQIEFSSSAPLPNSGEAIHRYLDRTKKSGPVQGRFTGEPWLLATALIPNLQGDQTVALVEKSSPEQLICPMGRGSGGGAPPSIYDANRYAEMSNYSHWEGGSAENPNPIRIWSWSGASTAPYSTPDFRLRLEGSIKNLFTDGSSTASMSVSTASGDTRVERYYYGGSSTAPVAISSPLFVWGMASQAPYQYSLGFRQLATLSAADLTPTAGYFGGELRAKQITKFTINTSPTNLQGEITRQIPVERVTGTRPIKVELDGPASSGGLSYKNVFKIKITNETSSDLKIMPFHPRSLFTDRQWITASGSASEVEIVAAPVSSSVDCTYQDPARNSVSEKSLSAGGYCVLHFAIIDSGGLGASTDPERLYLETRVRDSSGKDGYIQTEITPSGTTPFTGISMSKVRDAIYEENERGANYQFTSGNTYSFSGTGLLTTVSPVLVYADLWLQNNENLRIFTGPSLLSSAGSSSVTSIQVVRKHRGFQVNEATLLVDGIETGGSKRFFERLKVRFSPSTKIHLVGQYTRTTSGFYTTETLYSGQNLRVDCSSGSTGSPVTGFLTMKLKVSNQMYNANSTPTFNFSFTRSVSGGFSTFSPATVGGDHSYFNIDSATAVKAINWPLQCL